jgi:hypothetical protein
MKTVFKSSVVMSRFTSRIISGKEGARRMPGECEMSENTFSRGQFDEVGLKIR